MWLDVLAERAEQEGRSKVARTLGVSLALLSQVLNNKYPGDLDRVQRLVEGAYMNHKVQCPILGEIPLNECMAHQSNRKTTGNPMRIRLYKACRGGCPNSQLAQVSASNQPGARLAPAYDAVGVVRRLERQAESDGSNPYQLLKAELIALGGRYNRLINKEGGK